MEDNYTIITSQRKAERIIMRSATPLCSISGGSDSDIMLDLIHKADPNHKTTYYWIDTGLEYQATKDHLDYLEEKYHIEIECIKPEKPIPTCVREFGIPFLSKYVSEMIGRLQLHNFQWEDEPLEVLMKKYPRCKTALQWWCNAYYTDESGVQTMSKFSISKNRYLKEFLMSNPPDFPISNKCCYYAKKKPARTFIKETDADLSITGIRKAAGGVRSINYKTCFTECENVGCSTYRPIFWYLNADKKDYEQQYGIQHSRCYTKYGMRRTGCVGCPYNKHINDELKVIKEHEPKLYNAAIGIFGQSYEYTRQYREFVKVMKEREKADRLKMAA